MPTCYVTGYRPLALPLGEQSPQVTERGLQPFLNNKINLCAHTTKIPVDIPVGESQNLQTRSHQELRTFSVISSPYCLLVWSLFTLSALAAHGCLSQKGASLKSVRQIRLFLIYQVFLLVDMPNLKTAESIDARSPNSWVPKL